MIFVVESMVTQVVWNRPANDKENKNFLPTKYVTVSKVISIIYIHQTTMKHLFLFILFVIVSLIAACSNTVNKDEKCPCKVKIVERQDDGSYKLKVVEIKTLTNLDQISSPIIRMGVNSQVTADGRISQNAPKAQYIVTKNHTVVPTTPLTSELFALYKNMEDLHELDLLTGADRYVGYPMGINMYTQTGGRERKANNKVLNNAMYSVAGDQIIVLKYVEGDKPMVPMSINPGIIAHEHFHQIFQHIVNPEKQTIYKYYPDINPGGELPEIVEPTQGFNYLLLKTFNEGMADFWAYIHTGTGTSFLASDDDGSAKLRIVNGNVITLMPKDELERNFDYATFIKQSKSLSRAHKPIKIGESEPYVYGNIHNYAPWFSNFAKKMSEILFNVDAPKTDEQKRVLGKWVLESMQRMAQIVNSKKDGEELMPTDIVQAFVPMQLQDKQKSPALCTEINTFLKNYPNSSPCLN